MHPVQRNFYENLKEHFPMFFENVRALDIGSMDVNGHVRDLFDDSDYIGLDIAEGDNVDVVSIFHEYNPKEKFDVIVSGSALEHDMFIGRSLKHMIEILKPGGGLFISAACHWRKHGTRLNGPLNSATANSTVSGWADYYESVTPKVLVKHLEPDENFISWRSEESHKDARFLGMKIDETGKYPICSVDEFEWVNIDRLVKSKVKFKVKETYDRRTNDKRTKTS